MAVLLHFGPLARLDAAQYAEGQKDDEHGDEDDKRCDLDERREHELLLGVGRKA